MRIEAAYARPTVTAEAQGMLTLANVGVRAGATEILRAIDLRVADGQPTIVLGPNGAGKTTLLHVMMGLTAPTTGVVAMARDDNGVPVRRALVFQKPVMLKRSAAQNVAFALKAAGLPADAATVGQVLDRVGLADLGDRAARRLSGGEQQRLALARALARSPRLLLLDEPTASLDPAQTQAVEQIIAEVAAAGVKIVMTTHDLGQARRLAGDVVFLAGGRLMEHAPGAAFWNAPRTEAARRFLAGELIL